MNRRGMGSASTPKRWLAGVVIAVIAIGAVVLTALAFAHVRSAPENDNVAPVPTFTQPGDQAASSPTPTPTETTEVAPAFNRAQERFLATASGVLWRGVAGECGATEPLLERSTDDGTTWTDVTPRYLGIGQLIALSPFADGQAQIIASVGENCEVQALRTFTQGQFWESYPDVLAASQYVDPVDPASIVRPDGSVSAPCAEAHSLRGSGSLLAIVCAGHAYVLGDDAEWVNLSSNAVTAVAVDAADVIVAHRTDGCAGVTLTRYSGADAQPPTQVGCVTDADTLTPIAISTAGTNITLWSGDDVATVAQ